MKRIDKLGLYLFLLFFLDCSNGFALPNCKSVWKGNGAFTFQESYANYYSRVDRGQCEKDWTILVYMSADNNLFPYALWDLYEMEARFKSGGGLAGSTSKTDLVVEVDGPQGNDTKRLHIFSGDVDFSIRSKSDFENQTLQMIHSPVVESVSEDRAASQQESLSDFLLWGIERYPSKHLMVIVWSHGQGWKAYPVDKNKSTGNILNLEDVRVPEYPQTVPDKSFGGIAFKQSTGRRLDIPGLKLALESAKNFRGRSIDVYASDACLMQMIEVAHEIGDSAEYIVGTTQVQNFLGFPYRRLLYEINSGRFLWGGSNKVTEAYSVARMLPALVEKSLDASSGMQREAGKDAHRFVTSSALISQEIDRYLIPQMEKLSFALYDYLRSEPLRALDINLILQNVPNLEGSAQDIAIFLGELELLLKEEYQQSTYNRTSDNLRIAIINAKSALDRSTLFYVYGSAYGIDEATNRVGFVPKASSLWLPVNPQEYHKRIAEFKYSRFYKETQWAVWLDLLFSQQ